MIGILGVILLSVEKPPGRRTDASTSKMVRPIISQFALRTVPHEIWRTSIEERVCKEMNIQFKEDFLKVNREAPAKLWPKMQEAR